MSFGVVASSYPTSPAEQPITQHNSGIWTGTTMSVFLPASTAPSATLALIIASNTALSTPSGWTLRESQVNEMGHYLFTHLGGTNSWNITTNNGSGTWWVGEIAGATYDVSQSANNTAGSHEYRTPAIVPTVGSRLLMASVASCSGDEIVRTIIDWTDDFTEIADVCNPTWDYAMQGVAVHAVSADGVTGYATTASYSSGVGTRSAIITSFIL